MLRTIQKQIQCLFTSHESEEIESIHFEDVDFHDDDEKVDFASESVAPGAVPCIPSN